MVVNSENGNLMVPVPANGPNPELLVTDCVGCHSANDSSTAISSIGAPIVYNTSQPTFGNAYPGGPSQGLAGGNFYYVEHVDDSRGHNVFASNPDETLGMPPSGRDIACGTGSCHNNLTVPYAGGAKTYLHGRNGCTKCHMLNTDTASSVAWHHLPQNTGRFAGIYSDNGVWVHNWYRFLASPHVSGRQVGVAGYEDPDWEFTVSSADHNDYREAPPNSPQSKSYSVSGFCEGCHWYFYDYAPDAGDGAYHRHPTHTIIPDSGEYAMAYGEEHAYDPLVPVGQAIGYYFPGDMAPKETVTPGTDRVMCLTCHRAHASPYPKMLRFPYDQMQAGGGLGDGEGCFKCHTQKDGS